LKPATLAVILGTCRLAFGQPAGSPPGFAAADVHLSPKTRNPYVRTGPVHAGRYEIKYATMVDLVHLAYGVDGDKILGGPNWLEMDRFDIIAKVPPDTTPERLNLMLQSPLADGLANLLQFEPDCGHRVAASPEVCPREIPLLSRKPGDGDRALPLQESNH
jgi:hypothetical protein